MDAVASVGQQETVSIWRKRIRALRNIPPLFQMVWESAPKVVVSGLFCRVITALIPLGMLAVTRLIINSVTALKSQQHTPLPKVFWWFVAAEFALASLATVVTRLVDFFDSVLADRYALYVSTRVMEHAAKLDLTSYEDPVFYDKLERARVQGTDRIGMIQALGRLVQEIVTMGSLAASIYFFSPWILVILIVCLVPAFLGETHFASLGYSLSFRQTHARRELEYLRVLGASKESAKELKLFGLAPFLVRRYEALFDELYRQKVGLLKVRLRFGALLTLLGTLGYYGTYAFAIRQTVNGILNIGTLVFLAGAIAGASGSIQAVFSTFSSIADQALFLTDLVEFFSVKPRVRSKPHALPVPQPIRRGFEFKNVCFSYPGSSRVVLNNVSFRIGPSERIALVGENGQGKTTIVKLLTRLYDVTSGQILLDGVDLREYDLEHLWGEMSVIFQDFVRYEMTAAANIAMGRIEEKDNLFQIRAAALKSLAADVIRKLPKNYEQLLGCRFDGGVDLSGGEWQRIALARAYLRNAQVLILDEPTASLDARAEHDIFQRFAELTAEKMALLISHRLSTVRMTHRILVLANGRIAEEGPHDELVKVGGRYAKMFAMQASSYR